MSGTVNGNNNQVTINITDTIPPDNMATIDKNGLVGNTYTKTQFDQSFSAKANEIDTKIENIQQMVESDFKGTLKPTDTAPTEDGSYKPEVSSNDDKPADPNSTADWGKVYANAGNLRAKEGYDTMFYKKGITWKKSESKMPNTAAKIFNTNDNENPSTMKAAADRYDPAITALGNFAIAPGSNTIKNYAWADSEQILFGIAPQSGLLKSNNTIESYSSPDYGFKIWLNIPVVTFDFLTLNFTRIGGSVSNPSYVNLIGKKPNGSLDFIVKPDHDPATGQLENVSVDVTGYSSISIMLTAKNTDTVKPSLTFIKKNGALEFDAVKKYIDSKTATSSHTANYIDLIDYGCKGDGVTDDTLKFNEAIVEALSSGRALYGRSNTFKVSTLNVPAVNTWKKLEIFGDFMPIPTYGTIGNIPDYAQIQKGMRIISGWAGTTQNMGVLLVQNNPNLFDNFNFITLVLRNLVISTYDNPKLSGVQAYNAQQLIMHNVLIDTGVYNVASLEPTYETAAVVTPHNSNGAKNTLRNVMASGYFTGISIHEHTDGDDIAIHSCKHALRFRNADHASYFGRVLSQRNTNVVTVEGQHLFTIAQLNMEYVGSNQSDSTNAWQKVQYELNDPSNLAMGSITYANVRGGVGKVPYFRINGGSGVIVKRVGSDTRLTGAGIADPNPVT
ncbi:hypothetical protein FY557_17465 [Chryseobacterium sp. SN22]|uniref:glycosyl hydrolase family 28-related protein n=1 Tax=Chryseobacterium sp. SN22 TaxID=2606431 RepID=UPI0011EE9EF7|nr:glycosyl hydrolase family 28-related protein [Chryseobacterium sp. SN22]KAA0126439.1 hypothetical protein FY557_17465 [Chryseobacterium sp. SN22]